MPMRHHFLQTNRLLKKTVQTVREYRMIPPGAAILAGISGGPDSVCLLHVLTLLAQSLRLRLGIAHLNHGLRSTDSDEDADFVRSLAEKQNLPFFYKKTDVRKTAQKSRQSLEEAGRNERYAFFDGILDSHGFDRIALGHHRDDNAELILMNLLRGTGPSGLSGIPPVRGHIIRPLIKASRIEIMDCLAENALRYVTDHTNADPAFLRNKIRHELMPLLRQEYNQNVEATLDRLSDIFRREENWLERLTRETLDQAAIYTGKDEWGLCVSTLEKLHTAHLRRVLRAAIKQVKGNLRRIRLSQLDAAIEIVFSKKATTWVDLPDQIRLEKVNEHLIVRRASKNLRSTNPLRDPPVYHYEIRLEDLPIQLWIPEIRKTLSISEADSYSLPDLTRKARASVEFFDFDGLCFPLIVRNPEPGDRFVPFGMKGSQKIKDYFINNRVPKQERPLYPVVESRHQIVWLAGQRISNSVRVTPASKKLIKAELSTCDNDTEPGMK